MSRALRLARDRGITSESDLSPLFDAPSDEGDAGVIRRLRQIYEAGGWVLVESNIADLPSDLRWLYESGAVTLDQLAALHGRLAAASRGDFAEALEGNAFTAVPSLNAETIARITAALPGLRASTPRIPLGRAVAISEPLLNGLQRVPGVRWALPSGSLRRGEETVGDLELIAATTAPAVAAEYVLSSDDVVRCLHRSERRLYVLLDRVQIAVRLPEPASAGSELLYCTGSRAHIDALRARARAKGFEFTAAGLIDDRGKIHAAPSEEAVYARLDLPWIPPEIRYGTEEVAAASDRTLPSFVSQREIRGDLHMHTQWSDGRDTVEAMVSACRTLGYEYMAITDHSQGSAASRNLSVDDVKRQADEIDALRDRYPEIEILHGCEVDILPNGRLDFPDRVLERFDVVLASLHERAGHAPGQLQQRYVAAMKHPLVTIITHPTNRLVPSRAGYDLDYDRLFETAVETRTVVEIDGSPAHLDLDGALARRAVAAGATVAVDSDCHRADLLGRQMELGILTARRGWVEARHVLNTRPLGEVRAAIARKRAAR